MCPRPTSTVNRAGGLALTSVAALLSVLLAWGGIGNRWSGGADSANALLVGQNLLAGKGFTVEHLYYYAPAFPNVHHAESAFPLLHPALVALGGVITNDVFASAHVLQACLSFLYLGLLPLLVKRRYGALPGIALAVSLLALEGRTLFHRPLNDSGAMVVFAFGALEALYATEQTERRSASRAWLRAALLLALAAAYKASTAFMTMGLLAGALVFASRREQVLRVSWVVSAIALLQLPVLLWHFGAHGYPGLPHGAPVRNFVRTIPPDVDFWTPWEQSRTYFPRHPEVPSSFSALVEQQGAWRALLIEPLRRTAYAAFRAFVRGEVLRPGWLAMLAVAACAPRVRGILRMCAGAMLGGLLIAAYSHYEDRYLYPLRPLLGLALAKMVWHATSDWTAQLQRRATALATAGYLLLVVAGLLGLFTEWYATLDVVCLATFAAILLGLGSRQTALTGRLVSASAGALLLTLAVRAPLGVRAIHDSLSPRTETDAIWGEFVARHVPEDEVVMSRRRGLSLFARRPVIVTPFHTADVCAAAHRYDARWLLLVPQDLEKQPDLADLVRAWSPVAAERSATLFSMRCTPPGAAGTKNLEE